jgi:hypothetical protein
MTACVTITGVIDTQEPEFAADRIPAAYLDRHDQDPAQWAAEVEYR